MAIKLAGLYPSPLPVNDAIFTGNIERRFADGSARRYHSIDISRSRGISRVDQLLLKQLAREYLLPTF